MAVLFWGGAGGGKISYFLYSILSHPLYISQLEKGFGSWGQVHIEGDSPRDMLIQDVLGT